MILYMNEKLAYSQQLSKSMTYAGYVYNHLLLQIFHA